MKQEFLGYVDINLEDVVRNKRINEKFHLIDSKNGKLHVELQWRTSWATVENIKENNVETVSSVWTGFVIYCICKLTVGGKRNIH